MNSIFNNILLSLLASATLALAGPSVGATGHVGARLAARNYLQTQRATHTQIADASLKRALCAALYRPDAGHNGAVTLNNPAQGLHAVLSRDGLLLHSGRNNSKSARLTLTSVGYGAQAHVLPSATPHIEGKRVCFDRAGVSEWYLNTPRGIEQGFTLAARPGSGERAPSNLCVRLNASEGVHLKAMSDGKGVRLSGGGVNLVYRDLAAWDARHHALPAHMGVQGNEIAIQVDDRQAAYPITIDPLVQEAEIIANDGQIFDLFGNTVAISGDTAVVAAPDANNAVGTVYVFVRSGGQWTQQAELTPVGNTAVAPQFGFDVAISGDTIAVSAPADSSLNTTPVAGHVYVYQRSGTTWTREFDISDYIPDDDFGYSISLHGSHLAVGAPLYGNGAVYEYNYSGGAWYTQATLFGGSQPYAAVVATSDSVLAVWDPANNAVDVYTYTGSWNLATVLAEPGPSPDPNDGFGDVLAVDGATGSIAVGAPYTNNSQGVVYYYPASSGWSTYAYLTSADGYPGDEFGSSIAVQNSTLVAGAPMWDDGSGTYAGSAYVFTSSYSIWSQTDQIWGTDNLLGNSNSGFGIDIALDGNTVFVGASSTGLYTGAAYSFVPATAPVATDDSYATLTDTTLNVNAASGVLANDLDLGTGNFTAQLYTTTANGSLSLNPDGSFTYTPNTGFVGADTFQYYAQNDQGNSNIATVTIAVQQPCVLYVPIVPLDEGQPGTLKATLGQGSSFDPKHTVAGASLDFYADGTYVGSTTTDKKGNATLGYTPPYPGLTKIIVQFRGNSQYAPATGYRPMIVRNKTALNLHPDYATVGQGAIPSGYLTRTFDDQPVAGLTVTLSYHGKKVGTCVSDSNGNVGFNIGTQYHTGTFTYQANFKGDSLNQPCSATVTVTVTAAGTTTTVSNAAGAIGTRVLLKAKVIEQVGFTGLAGVPVSFSLNGSTIGTATTVKGGTATLSYSIAAGTPLGANQLTAQFAGNTDYNSSTSANATLTVSTNTTLTAANVTGSKGQSVTLSAQLLTVPGGSGVSGEMLAFSVDGKSVGSAATDGSGKASHSYTIPKSLLSGAHTIVVTHKAHAGYGSAAGSATLTVK
jgi:hypothetical protein